jgi:multiple sugar transport system permease protein
MAEPQASQAVGVRAASASVPVRAHRPRRQGHWKLHLILGAGAVLMVFPFGWQVLTAFKTFGESIRVPPTIIPHTWDFSNFTAAVHAIPFGEMLLNSVLLTAGRTIGQLVLCSLAGYAFARLRFPGRNAIFVAFLAMLMVPSQLFLIPQYQIMQSLGWLNSLQALIIPGMFSAFGTFLMRQFFMGLPAELEEAARLDGASTPQIFLRVMLPLATPGLTALAILTVLWSWNDLLWPLVVNTDPSKMPLSAGLATLIGEREQSTNYPILMAGSLLTMLPVIAVFLAMQRKFVEGFAFSGGKA